MSKKTPVNIITGFLGVGKTTSILHLLKNKPADENWAVLVNEFGEIGIDGPIIEDSGVSIKQVMGGCICCTPGGNIEDGLVWLLIQNRPDRILIEPTGLGHVRRILRKLKTRYFEEIIEVKSTVALIDPRHLSDERYMNNGLYRDQLAVADVIVGNKADLSSEKDMIVFEEYIKGFENTKAATGLVENGELNVEWLYLDSANREAFSHISHGHINHEHVYDHSHEEKESEKISIAEGERFIRRENNGSGYNSCGWLFKEDDIFSLEKINGIMKALKGERVKGIFNTDEGAIKINGVDGIYDVHQLENPAVDSRLEVIHLEPMKWDTIENVLLEAIIEGVTAFNASLKQINDEVEHS